MQAGLQYRELFLHALLNGDARGAEIAARRAMDAGLDELTVSERVIAPALKSVAEMCESGLIGEDEGAEAERISLRVLALQREAFRRSLQRGGEEIMLAELEGDPPTPELSDATTLLRRAGFRVRHLGSGLAILSLTRAVARHRPQAVVLHVTNAEVGLLLEYVLDEIELLAPDTKVLVGGPGTPADPPEHDRLLGWDDPSEIVAKVDSLVLQPALN
ncbi:MAG TPA: cobalamin-dependent protein [Thermoleophilaceae bacterium]|nr:cobalamin-dependent protein [Thermoleophilaceae bacterium]